MLEKQKHSTDKLSQTNESFHETRCPMNIEAHEKNVETITFYENTDKKDKSIVEKVDQEKNRQQLLQKQRERYRLNRSAILEKSRQAYMLKKQKHSTDKLSQPNESFHETRCPMNIEAHEKTLKQLLLMKILTKKTNQV